MQTIIDTMQMRGYEKQLMLHESITELDLMDRAAESVFSFLAEHHPKKRILLLCGTGNNGGDGVATLRKLHDSGFDAVAVLIGEQTHCSDALRYHLEHALAESCIVTGEFSDELLHKADVIVDALFGIGLSRPVTGKHAEVIDRVNAMHKTVIAVDIASGIDANTGCVLGTAIKADTTITFAFSKCGHVLQPGKTYSGNTIVTPLALTGDHAITKIAKITEDDCRRILPPRPSDSHKGDNGRAILFVGSMQYTGAALMSTAAALRTGCGILQVDVPGQIKSAFSALPEACCTAINDVGEWDETGAANAIMHIHGKRAIGMGSGMGDGDFMPLLQAVIESGISTVIDADALNLLSQHTAFLNKLHSNIILTPHPGEFSRLTGLTVQQICSNPLECAKKAAQQWNCVVLLKGAASCIAFDDDVVVNNTGNAGLAKGGSGDVLTGIITGLLSQGLSAFDAACVGSYLLGASAEQAMSILQERSLLARDVLDAITWTMHQPLV